MSDCIELGLDTLPLVRSADFCVTERPFVHPRRTLDYHVLVCILKGGMQIIEQGTVYDLRPGDMMFLKAGMHHWGERACPAGTTWIYIHFHLNQLEGYAPYSPYSGFLRNQEFEPADYRCALTMPKARGFQLGGALERKIRQLVEQYQSSDPLRAGSINALMMQLLTDVCRGVEGAAPAAENRVLRLIGLLEEEVSSPFDSAALSEKMGLSYKYLNELFQRETGMTLHRYHTCLRMNEAARLLRETSLSVTEISERLGFVNLFYFSSVFKKTNGVSPRQYGRGFFVR